MTTPLRTRLGRAALALVGLGACCAAPAQAAAAPTPSRSVLERAQELFQRNRWEEARAHLLANAAILPEKDRATAHFLRGRSYVREAEVYRALQPLALEVTRAYLDELQAQKANKGIAYIPLFAGFNALAAGEIKDAERSLALALAPATRLPAEWQGLARLRRAVNATRIPDAKAALPLAKDATLEGLYWRLTLNGELPKTVPALAVNAGRRERLLAAGLLYRLGRTGEAEQALVRIDLDAPDVEVTPDPKKVLRFFDPLMLTLWERVLWERAVDALRPAAARSGPEGALSAYYLGLSLFQLGALREAGPLLIQSGERSPSPELAASARLLASAVRWKAQPPAPAELNELWAAGSPYNDAVLVWEDLRRVAVSGREPFTTQLETRMAGMLRSANPKPAGATVGRWGLARLRRNADPEALLTELSAYRDHSNKNKLEWNDPLLLLALSGANYRTNEYAQALETLFEMAKTLPGLRGLQWNMQGVYAARQKAGGEARISQ